MFSKLGQVTVKTLHHYDEVGLLTPAQVDDFTGYRYYTTDQLFRLNEIVALRQMGFSIAEISAVAEISATGDSRGITGILEQRKAELENESQIVADRLFRINHYISERKEGKNMDYQAVIENIRESYIDGIWNKENVDDWLTEIQVPVAKK